MSAGKTLRNALMLEAPLLLPGAADALTARILQQAGFAAVYASGAGLANSSYAWPDLGLLGMSEVVDHVGRICQAVDVPVIADADTGFGGALNVARTVRALEDAGAAGVQIEDQVSPKRCGHFAGVAVVDDEEMLRRVRAALRSRQDPDTVVVGRTDAVATLGLDAAIRRARMLAEAGVDVVFVEAPTALQALARIPLEVPAPTLVNVVEGGRTPQLPLAAYAEMGFAVVLYANTAMRLAAHAVRQGAMELRRHGDSSGLTDRLLSWDDRQQLVRRDEYEEFAARLETADTTSGPLGSADVQEARST